MTLCALRALDALDTTFRLGAEFARDSGTATTAENAHSPLLLFRRFGISSSSCSAPICVIFGVVWRADFFLVVGGGSEKGELGDGLAVVDVDDVWKGFRSGRGCVGRGTSVGGSSNGRRFGTVS